MYQLATNLCSCIVVIYACEYGFTGCLKLSISMCLVCFVQQSDTDTKNDLFQSGSYIYQADPDQSYGDLSLTPTFNGKHGLQSSHSHENKDEPLSRKRRLTLDQTKSLEHSYSKDNKLEPAQRNKLALELGLQPRQVAIWYQNRRARSKAKSMEGKYNALKLQYQEVVFKNRRLEAEVYNSSSGMKSRCIP